MNATATQTRYAVVTGSAESVERYLPEHYTVVGTVGESTVLVAGRDVAGFTLGGFVLPRLASGLLFGSESFPEDWEVHRPIAPDAPIPGKHWYSGCEPAGYDSERGYYGPGPRVRPDGVCEGCGEKACPVCGCGFYPDGFCECRERL